MFVQLHWLLYALFNNLHFSHLASSQIVWRGRLGRGVTARSWSEMLGLHSLQTLLQRIRCINCNSTARHARHGTTRHGHEPTDRTQRQIGPVAAVAIKFHFINWSANRWSCTQRVQLALGPDSRNNKNWYKSIKCTNSDIKEADTKPEVEALQTVWRPS